MTPWRRRRIEKAWMDAFIDGLGDPRRIGMVLRRNDAEETLARQDGLDRGARIRRSIIKEARDE